MTQHVPVALVPGVLALLPEYRSIDDPVADLRVACLRGVRALGPRVRVVADGSGERVARHLVDAAGAVLCANGAIAPDEQPTGVLVVGNGSAKRTEQAPGHYDERAEAFDDGLRDALIGPDPAALRAVDAGLATELWADVDAFPALADLLSPEHRATVEYDAAPHGVQYWVIIWATLTP